MGNFSIKKMNTIVIHVTNLARSIEFYSELLGFQEEYVEETMGFFSVGEEEKISFLLHLSDEVEPVQKGISFDLLVDDVIVAFNVVKERDVVIIQEPIDRPWGVREMVILDPDGYQIWLVQNLY